MVDVMQHCFGSAGSGGPIGALRRMQRASGQSHPMIIQESPANGISFRLLARFVREIRSVRPRLLHVRGLGNEGFHGVLAGRIAGVPHVLVSIHGTQRDLRSPFHRWRRWLVVNGLERLTLLLATHVATVCESALKRDFLAPYRGKIVGAVPNGVQVPEDLDDVLTGQQVREMLGVSSSSIVGVCVSRLTPDKGYLVLADALKRMSPQAVDFHLLIVGGGDVTGEISARFQGIKSAKVHFVGQQGDVFPYLRAADVFLLPSLHENLSNALLEAMAVGLPVVTTSVGGSTEVVVRGGGLLVAPGDPHALARAIESMLASPTLRMKLGQEARRNIEANYSLQQMIDGWNAIYARILERRAGA